MEQKKLKEKEKEIKEETKEKKNKNGAIKNAKNNACKEGKKKKGCNINSLNL